MLLNIQIELIILKTYDQQFTLTTKKIIANHLLLSIVITAPFFCFQDNHLDTLQPAL